MIYFLTEQRLKSYTTVLGNVDAKIIAPLIPTLAEMWIQPRLGTYFYKDILAKFNAQTLNPDETTLVEYIQSSLLWRVASDVATTSSFQLTNKGIQAQYGSYSAQAGITEVGFVSKHYTQKAEFFDERLVSYLRLNKSKFPAFTDKQNTDCNIVDISPSKKSGYNKGILFM